MKVIIINRETCNLYFMRVELVNTALQAQSFLKLAEQKSCK